MKLHHVQRHETFSVGDAVRLDVSVPSGEVEIRTGSAGTVDITIEAADVDAFAVSQLGSTITVRNENRWRGRGRSVRVVAEVPPGTDVETSTAAADVRLAGRFGNTRVRTASGDVDIGTVGRLEVTTASGDCRVGDVDDDARVNAVSGDCHAGTIGGRLNASSASGDIRVGVVRGDLNAASTSGDVRVERCDGDDISLRSVSGDVVIGLPSGIRVDADISTLSGRTSLPDPADRPAGDPTTRRPVRLRLRSVSGDIRVERAG